MNAKWISFGLRLVPYIGSAISAVESIREAKGNEKLKAVKSAVQMGVEATESALDKDLLNDDKVQEALSGYISAYVGLQNAIAASKSLKAT